MTTIHATGTSELHLRAERATVSARVSVTSRARSESIAAATRLHNWAVQRAEQLRASGDATWHAADPISTWTNKSYAAGSKKTVVIEYTTSSRVRIKLSNLALVGEFVAELAEAGLSTDVSWALTEASRRECERRARKAAVDEARAVAEDYAEALGERIGTVVSISDSSSGGIQPQARFASARASDAGAAEVTVAEITVSASVAGRYETA
ncbi:SIMPL domain-containing protein [Leucobacter sp. CSA1]|uniref:SIMPL domain-containing protein n=1 Tax=Leucobacter chromiisoli TaxID=2796471 RepID=A0A934UVZ4_9MICO|nr:SIMPL domain-containing protein [Leucobacter chromiisoli]MBK0420425.1 SIMPL domain-containing protein [Leucobacter chromiisoli]